MPLAALLGIEMLASTPEEVSARLHWAPERCTTGGVLHGGALIALADTCGGLCAFMNLPADATGTTTIESKTNLVRAVTAGAVTAKARPLHTGRTTLLIEITATSDQGHLVAKTLQTQIVLRR